MGDALGIVRVLDKLFRIATRKNAFNESPWDDVAGYGLILATRDQEQRDSNVPSNGPDASFDSGNGDSGIPSDGPDAEFRDSPMTQEERFVKSKIEYEENFKKAMAENEKRFMEELLSDPVIKALAEEESRVKNNENDLLNSDQKRLGYSAAFLNIKNIRPVQVSELLREKIAQSKNESISVNLPKNKSNLVDPENGEHEKELRRVLSGQFMVKTPAPSFPDPKFGNEPEQTPISTPATFESDFRAESILKPNLLKSESVDELEKIKRFVHDSRTLGGLAQRIID
jgi:hypothetical protein